MTETKVQGQRSVDLGDVTTELDALADLVFFIEDHLEKEPTASSRTLANALYSVQRYIQRLSEDCMNIEMQLVKAERGSRG